MAKSKTDKTPKQEEPVAKDQQSFQSYNRVQLAGRLVADPDLRFTPSGKAVCRIRVATNDTQTAQFHNIVVWETMGEFAAENLHKGANALIQGRLQTRGWKAPDGTSRYTTEIVAATVNAA